MIRNIFLSVILSISSFVFLLHASEKPSSLQNDLSQFLPEEKDIGEWKRDGSPQEYKGEDLFLYINGGAEIYHEYGFKQVYVQDFRNKNGKSISVEIFEMLDSESAYGIYTFKTSTEGKELSLGDMAQLEDYYMNLWKGNFLVTLTGFDEDEETVRGLQEIARAVEAKIKTRGKRPLLVSMLPEKDLVKPSIKYFMGNLGLYNNYPFFTRDVFSLKKGVKGDYKTGYSIFLFNYKNGEEGQNRFIEVKTSFKESQRYKDFNPVGDELFKVKDSKGKLIFVSHSKNHILIIMGKIDQFQVRGIFDYIQKYLN
ncbi:MAG: hypothetical protein HQ555_03695 [Candidatus Aminicenantes bacterium]|nr:hypothetical protein [Candidatus Aminicenantes bacterium]